MSVIDLCALWERLIQNPADPATVEEARQHLVQFVSHVDDCDRCRNVSEHAENPELIFEALVGTEPERLPEAELEQLERGHTAFNEGTAAIEDAVSNVLLPSLPETLQPPAETTPMQLFLATDAVNMLARSVAADRSGRSVVLSAAGLHVGDELVVPAESIEKHIARHARVTDEQASGLLTWQRLAARKCATLYRGNTILTYGEVVMLTPGESVAAEDLATQWQPVPAVLQSESILARFRRIVREPLPIFEEAAPALVPLKAAAQVALTLDSTGESALGNFILASVKDDERCYGELKTVADYYAKKPAVRGVKPILGAFEPDQPQALAEATTVRSTEGMMVIEIIKEQTFQQKELFQGLYDADLQPGVDPQPLKMVAENGIKRADLKLAMLDQFVVDNFKFIS